MAGIPALPTYSQSDPRRTGSSHSCSSNLPLTSPVDRELCKFFQELNQSSSLGLTGSELLSLARGNFVPSPFNLHVEEPPRIPLLRLVDLFGDPTGGNSGLNSILPAAGRPHFDQGPSRACKSNGKDWTATNERGRLNTFSTAVGLKGQFGGRNPKSLACSHESFQLDDSSGNGNSIGRTTASTKFKSSGSGHQSKCPSSSEASFQCRVIKLAQREHMILQRYEKLTKSIDKLNKLSAAKKNNVQLFLLSRSQEVHVSGKDFDFARTNLLKFIRLSQVWWDQSRRKGATCKLTSAIFSNLNVQERLQKKMSVLSKLPSVQRGPKPEEIYSMTGASVDTNSTVRVISKQTSVGGIFQLFPHLCCNFPDCSNTSPNAKISKNCVQVQIQPEFLHSVFIEGDQKFDIMHKISSILAEQDMANVKVCLLQKSSAFHVLSEDDRFGQEAIKYLRSFMPRCGTLEKLELEFGNKSVDLPEPEVPQEPQPPPVSKFIDWPLPFPKIIKPARPRKVIKPPLPPKVIQPPKVTESPPKKCPQKRPSPPEIIKIEDTADISNVQLYGKEAPTLTSAGGVFQPFPHLCSSFPDCTNKFPGVLNDCSVVLVEDVFFHGTLIQADHGFNMMEKIRSILEVQGIQNVKVSLLRKSHVFHVLSPDEKFTRQAMNYLTSLLSRCWCLAHLENEFDCKPTDAPQGPKETQPPPLSKVTQPSGKKPIGTPQKRLPLPYKPKPCIKQQAFPVVAKPTPPIQPGMCQSERRNLRSKVSSCPNSQAPNHQRLRAWKPPKTSATWQTNNSNNHLPAHPRNQARMGPPRMPFGHSPRGFGRSPNNNFPWRPQGPPRHNPGQPRQQYPPFPPSQFPGGNNGYGSWNHGGQNNARYPQNNN